MEEAVCSGKLTPARNAVVFWLAVHHLSGHVFGGSADDEWNRLQLLRRLKRASSSVFDAVAAYVHTSGSEWPPAASPLSVPDSRKPLLARMVEE